MRRVSGVGIFGGTFNPIHLGHLRAAEEVAETLHLEQVIFVPSAQPPHKQASAEDPLAPAAERLAWVRAAVRDNPRFDVDALEVERGGSSFSVETLRIIGDRTAPALPVFIVGCDAFAEISTWREPRTLLRLANFAVIVRPPLARKSLAAWLPGPLHGDVEFAADGFSGRHRAAGTWIRLLEIAALDVSSSEIRSRLREGRSVRYLVPDAVIGIIARSGVYSRNAELKQPA